MESPKRLLVVGQQTQRWCDGWATPVPEDPVNYLIAQYAEFHLGKDYYASPFWLASHELQRRINSDTSPYAFAWSNLLKVDEDGGRPGDDIERLLLAHFNVLPEELAAGEPDVVVFFTGPHYDELLRVLFPRLEFRECGPALAALRHPALPEKCFRTYHPRYLRFSKQWNVLAEISRLAMNI